MKHSHIIMISLFIHCCAFYCTATVKEEPDRMQAISGKVRGNNSCSWFIFIGGSVERPVWTAREGLGHVDAPPAYTCEISSMVRIVKSSLGVDSIVLSSPLLPKLSRPRSFISRLKDEPASIEVIDPKKASPNQLANALVNGVEIESGEVGKLVLELMFPVSIYYSPAYHNLFFTGYSSDSTVVLAVAEQYKASKRRLLRLTSQLLEVAELFDPSGDAEVQMELGIDTSIKDIEHLWENGIFMRYGVKVKSLHIWDSMSIIEVKFDEKGGFAKWLKVLAGE